MGLLAAFVVLAGCSKVTGSKSSAPDRPAACTYVAKLDRIANTVATANVGDPVEFNKTLQTAVQDYVTNVRELRDIAPADLSSSLARVEADVQQFRFDAALTDRAPLDAYAARSCGRVASTATSSSSSPSTAPGGPTTTTTPFGG